MKKEQKFAKDLIGFIDGSPTAFHATRNVEKNL